MREGADSEFPIVVADLCNAFGEHVIHEDLSLKVRRGEILGVVGGSGSGKSVLMRSIIGLQQPRAGSIRVFGQEMTHGLPHGDIDVRSRWGVLFQGGALFSTLTVAENVEVPLRKFYPEIGDELRREIARYKVMLSGLPAEAADKFPSELSGGMKKRAGLARALALDPELLFLDEPTAGLDPHGRLDVYDLLRDVQAQGTTLVVTTHSFEEAQTLATHLVVLADGATVAQGSPREVVGDGSLEQVYFALTRKARP